MISAELMQRLPMTSVDIGQILKNNPVSCITSSDGFIPLNQNMLNGRAEILYIVNPEGITQLLWSQKSAQKSCPDRSIFSSLCP